jgi:hypothetical protein
VLRDRTETSFNDSPPTGIIIILKERWPATDHADAWLNGVDADVEVEVAVTQKVSPAEPSVLG